MTDWNKISDDLIADDAAARRSTLQSAVKSNPDAEAEYRKTARALGLPAVGVAGWEEDAKAQVRANQVDQFANSAPLLKRKYTDEDFAKLAHDDAQPLSMFESVVGSINGAFKRREGAREMSIGENLLVAPRAAASAIPAFNQGLYGFGAALTGLPGKNKVSDWFLEQAKVSQNEVKRWAGESNSWFTDQVQGAGRSAGLMTPGVAATLLSGGTATPVVAGAYIVPGAVSQGGQSAQNALEQGKDAATALRYGATDAAYEALLEKLPVGKLLGDIEQGAGFGKMLFGQIAREVPTEVATTLLQNFNEFAVLTPDKPFSEFLAEQPAAVRDTIAQTVLATGGVTTLASVAQKVTGKAKTREERAAQAEAQATGVQAMYDVATSSKLRERDAESFKQHIQEVTQDGPSETLFVKPEALQQAIEQTGVPPEEVAAALPSVNSQQASFYSGTAIAIPTAELMAALPGTDLGAALLDHLTIDPNIMSRAEVQETAQADVKAEVDRALAEQETDDSFNTSAERVKEIVKSELEAAGRFSPAINESYASLHSNFISTLAAKLGTTPEQAQEQYGASIVAQQFSGGYQQGSLPSGEYLFAPPTPTPEQMAAHGRVENIPLTQARRTQDKMDWARFEAGASPGALVEGYADKPVAVRLENGEYLIYDGHHRSVRARNSGAQTVEAYVIDAKDYAPTQAGRKPSATDPRKARAEDDALLRELGFEQGARGLYAPGARTIALLQRADLSTFIHETGHYFLDVQEQVAAQIAAKGDEATVGEREILNDMNKLLAWFKVADLDTWLAMSLDEKRPYHEQLARGFEHYIAEGKAPTTGLQQLFGRLRAWMLRVYKSLADLNVALTDEVRQVFDRMLATTEMIREAEIARDMVPLFESAEQAGMTAAQWREYQNSNLDQTQTAINALQSRSVKDLGWLRRKADKVLRGLQKENDAAYKGVRDEVAAEVMAEPVNRAREYLRTSDAEGKLSVAALKEMYPLAADDATKAKGGGFWALRTGKRGYLSASGGAHPDVVAEMFGYESGDALVRAILNEPTAQEQIEVETEARAFERYGDLKDPETVARAADEAIHNEAHDKFVATEAAALRALAKMPKLAVEAIKATAAQRVGQTRVREIRPDLYAASAARAAREAESAFGKGDVEAAANAKQRQYYNTVASREAFKAKDELASMDRQFKRVMSLKDDATAKRRDMNMVNAARAIIAEYGYGDRGKDPASLLGVLKDQDKGLYDFLKEQVDAATRDAGEARDMTLDHMRAVREIVTSLMVMSKRSKQIEIDGKLIDLQDASDEIKAELEVTKALKAVPLDRALTDAEKFTNTIRATRNALTRVETWAELIGTQAKRYIFTRVSDANTQYLLAHKNYTTRFVDLLKTVQASLTDTKIAAPEIGYTFANKAELLHAILHTGNDSNLRKLLIGRKWASYNELDDSLDTARWDTFIQRAADEGMLTKADFDFAQGVWDLLESTKSQAQKAHQALYGRYFNEVQATALQTPFGEYRGGYVPAITDPNLVSDQALRAAQEAANDNPANMFPAAANGFTKARVENYNRELALDLRLIPQHLDKVLKFSYLAPAVSDVGRLLNMRGLAGKLQEYDTTAMTSLLTPWLTRTVKQQIETPPTDDGGRFVQKAAGLIRTRTSMQIMAFNLVNTLQQITGFSLAAIKVKPQYLTRALWASFTSPQQGIDAVRAESDYMKTRNDEQAYEMRQAMTDLLTNPSALKKVEQWAARHAYWLQQSFANLMEPVIWHAAKAQALDEGRSLTDAVRDADGVVRQTQGASRPVDVSKIETGSPMWRMMTMFAGYFNMQANLVGGEMTKAYRDLGLKRGAGRLAFIYIMGVMLPAVMSELISQIGKGGPGDGEDDDWLTDYMKIFFGSQVKQIAAFVPVGGQVVNAAWEKYAGDYQNSSRVGTSPVFSAAETALSLPQTWARIIDGDGNERKAARDTLSTLGIITGLPLGAAGRPIGYGAGVASGDIDPTDPVDAVRGTVTGAASKASQQ